MASAEAYLIGRGVSKERRQLALSQKHTPRRLSLQQRPCPPSHISSAPSAVSPLFTLHSQNGFDPSHCPEFLTSRSPPSGGISRGWRKTCAPKVPSSMVEVSWLKPLNRGLLCGRLVPIRERGQPADVALNLPNASSQMFVGPSTKWVAVADAQEIEDTLNRATRSRAVDQRWLGLYSFPLQ